MNHKNDQTLAHQAADVVDNVADGISSTAHNVGESIRNAAQTVRHSAGRAVSAVEDTYEEAGQYARDSIEQGRAKVRSWENNVESYVRENPKSSLLLAAALGAVVFAWWKHR